MACVSVGTADEVGEVRAGRGGGGGGGVVDWRHERRVSAEVEEDGDGSARARVCEMVAERVGFRREAGERRGVGDDVLVGSVERVAGDGRGLVEERGVGFVRERAEEDVAEGAVGAPQAEDLAVRQRVAIGRGGEARLARAVPSPTSEVETTKVVEGRREVGTNVSSAAGLGARARGRQGEEERSQPR